MLRLTLFSHLILKMPHSSADWESKYCRVTATSAATRFPLPRISKVCRMALLERPLGVRCRYATLEPGSL
jgi:hypothetical protein